MNCFYIPDPGENDAEMGEEESRHCIGVFRHKLDDIVQFTDGRGSMYSGKIMQVSRKSCSLKIISRERTDSRSGYFLRIVIAPTKSIDRFEFFLEKSTEIGVDEIVPIVCKNSERTHIREDRLKKVLIASMKQSGKSFLPNLHPLVTLDEFLNNFKNGAGYIAHCQDKERKWLIGQAIHGEQNTVLIGPEGDFSEEEIEKAISSGFIPVSLGQSVLRTETAGIVVSQIFMDKYLLGLK